MRKRIDSVFVTCIEEFFMIHKLECKRFERNSTFLEEAKTQKTLYFEGREVCMKRRDQMVLKKTRGPKA